MRQHPAVQRERRTGTGPHLGFKHLVEFGGVTGVELVPVLLREQAGRALGGRVLGRVGDQGGDPVFFGRGPGRQEATPTPAHQHDPLWVHLGSGQQPVDLRGDNGLPVGAEDQTLFDQWPALARTVDQQHGVTAPQRRPATAEIGLFLGAVVPTHQHHRGERSRAVGPQEVTLQCRLRIGYLDNLRREIAEFETALKGVALPPVGLDQPRGGGRPEQKDPGRAVVGRGAEVPRVGADPLARGPTGFRVGVDSVRQRRPLGTPGVLVARRDTPCLTKDSPISAPPLGTTSRALRNCPSNPGSSKTRPARPTGDAKVSEGAGAGAGSADSSAPAAHEVRAAAPNPTAARPTPLVSIARRREMAALTGWSAAGAASPRGERSVILSILPYPLVGRAVLRGQWPTSFRPITQPTMPRISRILAMDAASEPVAMPYVTVSEAPMPTQTA